MKQKENSASEHRIRERVHTSIQARARRIPDPSNAGLDQELQRIMTPPAAKPDQAPRLGALRSLRRASASELLGTIIPAVTLGALLSSDPASFAHAAATVGPGLVAAIAYGRSMVIDISRRSQDEVTVRNTSPGTK